MPPPSHLVRKFSNKDKLDTHLHNNHQVRKFSHKDRVLTHLHNHTAVARALSHDPLFLSKNLTNLQPKDYLHKLSQTLVTD